MYQMTKINITIGHRLAAPPSSDLNALDFRDK